MADMTGWTPISWKNTFLLVDRNHGRAGSPTSTPNIVARVIVETLWNGSERFKWFADLGKGSTVDPVWGGQADTLDQAILEAYAVLDEEVERRNARVSSVGDWSVVIPLDAVPWARHRDSIKKVKVDDVLAKHENRFMLSYLLWHCAKPT